MKLAAMALSCTLAFAASGIAQTKDDTSGAKKLFYDTTTGAAVSGGGPQARPASPAPSNRGTAAPAPPAATAAPAGPAAAGVTGLMYYVEVIQPNGQAVRVNSDQVFHTGQRVRFHVLSNLSGKLTILQSENGEAFSPLFPNPQLRGGDDRVEGGKDTVIPMVFDNRPGNIRLLLMLVADGASAASPVQAAAAAPARVPAAPAPAPAPAGPTPTRGAAAAPVALPRPAQPAPPVTLQASNDAPAARRSPLSEADIRAVLGSQANSKGLKIEVDQSAAQAATFVVVDAREQRDVTPGMVAVEVRLTHQP